MKTEQVKEIMSWLKTTDLVEISYKAGGTGFSLATAEAPAAVPEARFPSRYSCVASPAVGVFQPQALGKAGAEEGAAVGEGDPLGLVDTGGKAPVPVKASCAGRVARVMVEPGQAVQYGQPLFLLEPR
jgi:acetyl-CoA carboxylase biotin carboxyl carrier protein